MKTTVYLLRHGTTDWNEAGKYQGSSDIPLNEKGREEARIAGQSLANVNFAALYSSPLKRAHHTALEIAKRTGAPIQLVDELRERSYGDYEGLTFGEIEKDLFYQTRLKGNWYLKGAPNGESFEAVVRRVGNVLLRLVARHPNETIGIIAHGVVLKSIGFHIGHIRKTEVENVIIHNARPFRIDYLHKTNTYTVIDFPLFRKR